MPTLPVGVLLAVTRVLRK